MSVTALRLRADNIFAMWRQQIRETYRLRRYRPPRGLAAVVYLVRGKSTQKLVDLRRLTVCVLHDQLDQSGLTTTRFAAYRLQQIPWGIAQGGAEQIVLDKDLLLVPRRRS